jgi:hypothetical protein
MKPGGCHTPKLLTRLSLKGLAGFVEILGNWKPSFLEIKKNPALLP